MLKKQAEQILLGIDMANCRIRMESRNTQTFFPQESSTIKSLLDFKNILGFIEALSGLCNLSDNFENTMSLFTEGLSRGTCNIELLWAHEKYLDNALMEERKACAREGGPRSKGCIVLKHKFNGHDQAA